MLVPRAIVLCAVAAAGLVLSSPPMAVAQTAERFSFTATPARSGVPVTLAFDFGTTAPWTTGRFGFAVPRARWNGRRFPTCSLRILRRDNSARRCPRGSRIGSGRALYVHGGPELRLEERFRVTAVNGGSYVHMFWHGAPVANAREGRTLIWRGVGITEWVPLDFVEIAGGLTATMERFSLELGATWRGRSLVALRRCRGDGWRASAVVHYRDSSPATDEEFDKGVGLASDFIRCRTS
jgi:hypothetical protein